MKEVEITPILSLKISKRENPLHISQRQRCNILDFCHEKLILSMKDKFVFAYLV
jgi:hypothetical protein